MAKKERTPIEVAQHRIARVAQDRFLLLAPSAQLVAERTPIALPSLRGIRGRLQYQLVPLSLLDLVGVQYFQGSMWYGSQEKLPVGILITPNIDPFVPYAHTICASSS